MLAKDVVQKHLDQAFLEATKSQKKCQQNCRERDQFSGTRPKSNTCAAAKSVGLNDVRV